MALPAEASGSAPARSKTEELKSPSADTPAGGAASSAPSIEKLSPELKEYYFQEADEFFRYCEGTHKMNQYYDCECLASTFLDKRISYGPERGRDKIMLEIQKSCPDATRAAGSRYQTCISASPTLPAGVKPEEYCECFANTFAKLYERDQPGPSSRAFVRLETEAYVTCNDPSLAKKLYPFRP